MPDDVECGDSRVPPKHSYSICIFHRREPKTGQLRVALNWSEGGQGQVLGTSSLPLSLASENCFTVPSWCPNLSFHVEVVPEALLLDAPLGQDLSRISCVGERQGEQINPPRPFPKYMKLSPW